MSSKLPNTLPSLSPQEIADLARRYQLNSKLLYNHVLEQITSSIFIEPEQHAELLEKKLGNNTLDQYLSLHSFTLEDLNTIIHTELAAQKLAYDRFRPGLEEYFITKNGGYDLVTFSLIRLRNPSLAQELWLRLTEHEANFSDLARMYGEGPEAVRLGVIGPTTMMDLNPPEFSTILRSLAPGRIQPPTKFGDMYILIRLESLTITPLDDKLQQALLNEQFEGYVNSLVAQYSTRHNLDEFS